MERGTPVEVFNHFDNSWVTGFQLVQEERDENGRVLARVVRRRSDHAVLPRRFPAEEVRRVRSFA